MWEKLKKYPVIEQFAKFALVGVMNTLVDLIILNFETYFSGVKEGSGYAVQKGVSFICAVIFNYFINKRWTFEDTSEDKGKKFSQFIVISVIGMLINVTVATMAITYAKPIVNSTLNMPFL
ncbi:MAG: GtrA family protein, partial [Candidatus Moranbacteria bacterium]|nr:GtrA family protein [Candidatus Moranbacteria bacterium]